MFFKVIDDSTISEIEETFHMKELNLEKLISMEPGEELNNEIFGESLLFLGRQITLGSKRFDTLALDRLGRCVIIELKKDSVFTSAAMQSLDYLSLLSTFTGETFFKLITNRHQELSEPIQNFINDISELNKSSRIILIGQGFHPSVFSLGKWISDKNVPFKCIKFKPILMGENKFLNFSTVFSASACDEYADSLKYRTEARKPQKFWHILNYGDPNKEWWDYCQKEGIIALNYENIEDESCPGFRKMNDYIIGDEVFIWANGFGLIGHGKISGNYEYKSHKIKSLEGHSHTRKINWTKTVPFKEAVSSSSVKKIKIGNPRQGKQQILQNKDKTSELLKLL